MATFVKINDWMNYAKEDVDTASDTFKLALTLDAPTAGTDATADNNGVIANISEITYTNYSDDLTVDRVLESVTSTQTGGTYKFDAGDVVITASGGAIPDFRYVVIYDDTVAGDPLVGYWDYGSTLSLADTETLTITFGASGIYTIA
jgi:hypothetical protein